MVVFKWSEPRIDVSAALSVSRGSVCGQAAGADARRPVEKVTPGAAALFSFEPSRALGSCPPWCSSLKESPGSSKAERFDLLRGWSDQPAWGSPYTPPNERVK